VCQDGAIFVLQLAQDIPLWCSDRCVTLCFVAWISVRNIFARSCASAYAFKLGRDGAEENRHDVGPMKNRRAVLQILSGAAIFCSASRMGHVSALSRKIKPDTACVLIVVDVQNCFMMGGNLAVPHGEDVVPIINRIAPAFDNVVITQDWHPNGHVSFASAHAGRKPFETIHLAYGRQVLWPDHCVQGTADAALARDLNIPQAELIVRKGFHRDVDSYSAFEEADRKTTTGLRGYLEERGIKRVFVTGLATDFCVAWTALDARKAGFDTYVIEDACRGIDLNGSVAAAWREMKKRGAMRIRSTDIELG
jgi:nicotinamidase/pyrazinamidase